MDPSFINWSDVLKKRLVRKDSIRKKENPMIITSFRPFTKKWMYYDEAIIHRQRKYSQIGQIDKLIFTTGTGISKDFSCLITNHIPNYHYLDTGRAYYQEINDNTIKDIYSENVTDFSSEYFDIKKEDIIYYVYALLHHEEFRNKYLSDLNKQAPRIPIVKEKINTLKLDVNYQSFILIMKSRLLLQK